MRQYLKLPERKRERLAGEETSKQNKEAPGLSETPGGGFEAKLVGSEFTRLKIKCEVSEKIR